MADIIEFKCPNCDGAIHFDSHLQKMKCPFCSAEIELESLKELDQSLDELPASKDLSVEAQEDRIWSDEEATGLQVYSCQSCGGQLITDETTIATSCPYCDNPVALSDRLSGDAKPELIVPFQLDKQEAVKHFHHHLTGKRLLPAVFKDEQHIKEIKGLYVPFWIFDADVASDFRFKGTKNRNWSDGSYTYTEQNYYQLHRSAWMHFQGVPVDASSKLDNALMESLEPYDLSAAVPFQTAYLAGFLADRYDETAEDSVAIANSRIQTTVRKEMQATVYEFNNIQAEEASIRFENAKSSYVLLPVWTLHTTWKGQSYLFAMNGQTGKFIGNLPMDRAVYWRYFGLIFLLVFLVALGLTWLLYSL